jgi:hypothetical protein
LLVIGGIIIGMTVLAAVGRVGRGVDEKRGFPDAALAVGECITDSAAAATDLKPVNCDDSTAVLELASRSELNMCPDGRPPSESDYLTLSDGSVAYCFVMNLKQNKCYAVDAAKRSIKLVDCSADRALLVVKRVDGKAGESACGAGSKAIGYRTPPLTYCLRRP